MNVDQPPPPPTHAHFLVNPPLKFGKNADPPEKTFFSLEHVFSLC